MKKALLAGLLVSLIFLLTACQKANLKPLYQRRETKEVVTKPSTQAKKQEAEKALSPPSIIAAELPEEPAIPASPTAKEVTQQVSQETQVERPLPQRRSTQAEHREKEEMEGKFVALNFDNADIYDFIQSISEITGINYIIAPGVAGKITVKTSGKIAAEEVLALMDTILEVYNLAAVKTENLYKIVPIDQVKKVGPQIRVGREAAAIPAEDRVIVQIVKLDYLSPATAMEVLQPFLSVHGETVPFAPINVLVIIDSASNVRRLLGLVDIFDVDLFKNLGVKLYPVQNVGPSDLAKELKDVFSALGIGEVSAGGGLEVIPFDRLSSLLIVASTPRLLQSAESWLKELDRETVEAGIQTYVYYVENGEAGNIASILSQLYISAEKRPPRTPTTEKKEVRPRTTPARPEKKEQTPTPKPPAAEGPKLGALVTGEIKIVSDEATNALIIQAIPSDYKIIEKTIKELDLRPKQVLIEVLIAEVTLSKGLDFGVQWTVGHASKRKSTAGAAKSLFVPARDIQDISDFRDVFATLAAGIPGFTYSLTSGDEIFLLLDALATVTDVDILSSPNVLASDNKEAKINVGDEVPIVTSEQLPVGAEQTRFRNIQYRQTGVTLTVTPHINSKNLVTINIKQEVSEVAAGGVAAVQAETPTISTRNAETTVVVQDGQTILLGGLISKNSQKVESKVPVLGSIPVMGRLFKTTSDSYRRRELILLITPRVISTDEDAGKLTEEFKERIESLKARIEELKRKK